MSDDVHCDSCKKSGRRRRMYPAPDDWFFLEAKDDESGDVVIVYACSVPCAASMWQKGPGARFAAADVLLVPETDDAEDEWMAKRERPPERLDDVTPEEVSAAIVLTPAEWERVKELCDNPPEPTEALRRLMRGEPK